MDDPRRGQDEVAPVHAVRADGSRFRVLLVDDDPQCLESTALVLAADFDVRCVDAPERALAHLAQGEFDLLVTAQQLPGMTGAELFGRIQAMGLQVGCVISTHHLHAVPAQVGQEPGLVAVVEKPTPPARLTRLLQQVGRLVELDRALRAVRPA